MFTFLIKKNSATFLINEKLRNNFSASTKKRGTRAVVLICLLGLKSRGVLFSIEAKEFILKAKKDESQTLQELASNL